MLIFEQSKSGRQAKAQAPLNLAAKTNSIQWVISV